MYFVLDSLHADYASLLAALATASATKYSFTPTQVVRNASHNANIKIVPANITEAERVGDLAPLARSLRGTGVYKDEYLDQPDKTLKAFDLLGESGRTPAYIRPGTGAGSSPGAGYGAGDGYTYGDAFDGFEDTVSIGASWATNTTYWICDFICGVQKPTGGFVYDLAPTFQDATAAPMRWRMDDQLDPGMLALFSIDTRGTNNAFTRPDAGSFPRVWQATFNTAGTFERRWLTPIDPTLSTTDIYANHMFKDVASQAALEAEEMTRWENSGDLWIHMPDDTDPNDRIGGGNPDGYSPGHIIADGGYMAINSGAALQGLEFINCQMIGHSQQFGGKMSNGVGAGYLFPQAKFLGGRYLMGASWKPEGACIAGTEWGRSTDGDILWDTSDRPTPGSDTYIQLAVSRHGSDQAVWDQMDHFLEMDSSEEGIYFHGGGEPSGQDDGVISGVLFRHVGTAHPTLLAKTGLASMYDDGDSHAWAFQGGSDWDVGFMYAEKAGSFLNLYSITDTTNAQTQQNNAVHDFVLRDSHQKFLAGAGQNGIAFNGDGGAYARTNGSGAYAGNTIQRGVIYNIIGDPDGTKFGSPGIIADGAAIFAFNIDELWIDNVSVVACTHGFDGQRNGDMALGAGGVTNPAVGAWADPQFRAHNCYWDQIIERIVHMRITHWNDAYKTIVSITKANPCVVEITGHGFPDILDAGTYIEPEVYFANMVGMTELDDNIYKAVWIDANTFSLKTLAGAAVDSTAFGTFTSGDCQRTNVGHLDLQDNTVILPGGKTSASDIYRGPIAGDQTLAEFQTNSRRSLPGASSDAYETGTTIAP